MVFEICERTGQTNKHAYMQTHAEHNTSQFAPLPGEDDVINRLTE